MLACRNHCSSRRSSATLRCGARTRPCSGFVSTVWIIVFLGWLNPRFDGETRRQSPGARPRVMQPHGFSTDLGDQLWPGVSKTPFDEVKLEPGRSRTAPQMELRRLFPSDPFPAIGVCSVLLIVEFSLKLSRTPPITGRGRAAFYRTLVLCRTPTGGSESERKGLQKNAGTMSTKRIFTMVMPGKIIA